MRVAALYDIHGNLPALEAVLDERYDVETAAERIRTTNFPTAEEFASVNVLHPPTEAAMLDAYAKSELK